MEAINHKVLDSRISGVLVPELESIIKELRAFIDEARASELVSINPRRIAKDRGLEELSTIRAFLHLTQAGVFDLSWAVHCPHCKGSPPGEHSMIDLRHDAFCPVCKVDFEARFDQNVELTFSINPSVAELTDVDNFEVVMGSVELEPGISLNLEPGEKHRLEMPISPGNYWLLCKGSKQVINIPVSTGSAKDSPPDSTSKLSVSFSERDDPVRVFPFNDGTLELDVTNNSGNDLEFVFSKARNAAWTDAALVSSLQEFRDMFAREMVSPEESFSIENICIIFTDIKSSTEMYERLGDSKAFYLVKEHFKILEDVVAANDGAVVKTIGDAVMAVFTTPRKALVAAKSMIEAFEETQNRQRMENTVIVKVGAHLGPCIAVSLNDRLDYFGTTINMAARIQGLSDGRDVMISQRLFDEGDAAGLFKDGRWRWDTFQTSLKGLSASHPVCKLYFD